MLHVSTCITKVLNYFNLKIVHLEFKYKLLRHNDWGYKLAFTDVFGQTFEGCYWKLVLEPWNKLVLKLISEPALIIYYVTRPYANMAAANWHKLNFKFQSCRPNSHVEWQTFGKLENNTRDKCMSVRHGLSDYHTFVSYFQVFQISTIPRVFGLQLWNVAVLLILTLFCVMGSFLWLMKSMYAN